MLSCFGTVFQPHSLSGHLPYWNIFTTVLECFGSQGRKSEPTNRKPPDPDPWRFQTQSPYPYRKAREKESFVWPVSIGLHLFALVSVAVHMWFYALHLRAFGFSLMEWTMATFKLVFPQHIMHYLCAPFVAMKGTRWKDCWMKFKLLATGIPAFYWYIFLRDSYHCPEDPTPSKPKPQGRPSSTKKIIFASLAALSTLTSTCAIQLCSEKEFCKSLQ